MKRKKCLFCRQKFPVNDRGRKRSYCTRAHRQRAYEARREKRKLDPWLYAVEKDFATLRLRKMVIDILREVGFLPPGQPASVLKLVEKDKKPKPE